MLYVVAVSTENPRSATNSRYVAEVKAPRVKDCVRCREGVADTCQLMGGVHLVEIEAGSVGTAWAQVSENLAYTDTELLAVKRVYDFRPPWVDGSAPFECLCGLYVHATREQLLSGEVHSCGSCAGEGSKHCLPIYARTAGEAAGKVRERPEYRGREIQAVLRLRDCRPLACVVTQRPAFREANKCECGRYYSPGPLAREGCCDLCRTEDGPEIVNGSSLEATSFGLWFEDTYGHLRE